MRLFFQDSSSNNKPNMCKRRHATDGRAEPASCMHAQDLRFIRALIESDDISVIRTLRTSTGVRSNGMSGQLILLI